MIEEFNCESTMVITLLPFTLFVVYTWLLSDNFFVPIIMNPVTRSHRRRRLIPKNSWYSYILKKTLTLIIVWSGITCWSHGLLRNLNVYTPAFISTINDSLQPNYKMDQTTIQVLEAICKWLVCCSVVACVWWSYVLVDKNRCNNIRWTYPYTRQTYYTNRGSRFRTNNELGEDGHISTQNMLTSGLNLAGHNVENETNRNPGRLRRMQSCQNLKTEKILGKHKTI